MTDAQLMKELLYYADDYQVPFDLKKLIVLATDRINNLGQEMALIRREVSLLQETLRNSWMGDGR